LNRAREELHVIDDVMLTVVYERLAGPCVPEDVECFVEHLASRSVVELLARL
jgi:hypothetical protein